MPSPTQQPAVSWTELLETVRDFFKAEPWKTIQNEPLFAIDNPYTGEVLYCTVIGASGDVFGLSIHPGATGLYTYLLTQQQRLQQTIPFYYMDCLLVALEDQRNLSPEDKRILKQSKIAFPKGTAKPQFRSFSSGYVETIPDAEERYAINLALQVTLDVLRNWTEYQRDFETLSNLIPIIAFDASTGTMDIRYEDLEIPSLPMLTPPPLNEIRMRSLVKQSKKQGTWEGSLYYIPDPVQKKGKRGFFPCTAIWGDHHSGMILGTDMAERTNCSECLVRSLCTIIEQTKTIPEVVLIDHRRIAPALLPTTEALGISLREVDVLPLLENVTASLSRDHFEGDPISPVMGPDIISEEAFEAFVDPEMFDHDEALDDDEAWDNDDTPLDAYEAMKAELEAISHVLTEFADGLIHKNLAQTTVENHINNVSAFIFRFLRGSHDPPLSIEEGIDHVQEFFDTTLAMGTRKPSKSLRKSMLASIRKFYAFLAHRNYIPREAMKQLNREIKANRERWTS